MCNIDQKDNFRQWSFFCAEVGAVPCHQLSICLLKSTRIELMNFRTSMTQIHQVHQVASSRHDYVFGRIVMPSAIDCEIASLLVNVRLPLLSPGVRFCPCSDIRVRAIVK